MLSSRPSTTRRPAGGAPKGLTIIELMIVMAIMAGVMGSAIYSLGFLTQANLRNEAMRMTSAIQYTWGRAAMTNTQYRMVIDLDEGTYRTEVTDAEAVERKNEALDKAEDSEEDDDGEDGGQGDGEADDSFKEKDDKDPFNLNRKPTYEQVESSIIKEHTLPSGLSFHSVVTANGSKPITEGRAAIRFFPSGFQEPAIITLKSGPETFYSLKTEALTGRVKIYSRKLEKPEAFGKPDEVQEEW